MNRIQKQPDPALTAMRSFVLLRTYLVLAGLLLAGPVLATDKLPAFTAVYGVEKYGVKLAEATYTLEHTDKGYRFRQKSELHGLASMFASDTIAATSVVNDVGDRLLLKRHRYTQTGREKNRNESFHIIWKNRGETLSGHIEGTVRSKPVDLKVEKPVWDMLSFQIPLMLDASRDKKQYPYYALLKGELDTYFFDLVAIEQIELGNKSYEALKLVRVNNEKKRELRLWLIPELNNIPAIVENMRDGKQHSYMSLESLNMDGRNVLTVTARNDTFE